MSNNISKNGFYIIDESFEENINIEKNIYAIVFLGNNSNSYTFNLMENSRMDFYSFGDKKTSPNIEFHQEHNNSTLNVKTILFCENTDLNTKIDSEISSEDNKCFIDIIGIIKDKNLSIDSSIKINNNAHNIEAKLNQKNVFIGEKGKVRGLPKLFVESMDVKASHACQVEKINAGNLFYLTSRGISEKKATSMIIESYFVKNFGCLSMIDKAFYEKLYNNFLSLNN